MLMLDIFENKVHLKISVQNWEHLRMEDVYHQIATIWCLVAKFLDVYNL